METEGDSGGGRSDGSTGRGGQRLAAIKAQAGRELVRCWPSKCGEKVSLERDDEKDSKVWRGWEIAKGLRYCPCVSTQQGG
jgi:hypothetical protein